MKKPIYILLLFFCSVNVFSQNKKYVPLSVIEFKANINAPLSTKEKSFIDEVYGDEAKEFIYDNAHRLKVFKQILRNRIDISFHKNKNLNSLKLLSQIPLVNSINPNLKRDFSFDINNFNPLKYKFGFFSNDKTKVYRVDNTQYVITILQQH